MNTRKVRQEVCGEGHAEVAGVEGAKVNGLAPTGAAASRPICDGCADYLEEEGVEALSPLKTRKEKMVDIRAAVKLLGSEVERFDQKQCVVFILYCAERMFPNYVHFFRETKFGDPSFFRSILDLGWRFLENGSLDTETSELKEEAIQLMPDTEDFRSVSVSSALDASASAVLMIEAIESADRAVSSALEVASLAVDSVDMYVQVLEKLFPGQPDLEDQIDGHPLMQAEIEGQLMAAERISDASFNSDEIAKLRAEWRAPRTSNLGHSVE